MTHIEVSKIHCIKIYGDGYCIVESVRHCLLHAKYEISSKDLILNEIEAEVLIKFDYYRQFMNLKENDPVVEITNYVKRGVYDSNVGDMILHVLANLLNIRIVVLRYYPLSQEYRHPHQHFVISPVDTLTELPVEPRCTIMLKKDENHYDGLVFKGMYFYMRTAVVVNDTN